LLNQCEQTISIDHKDFLQPPEEVKQTGGDNSESLSASLAKHTLFIKGMSDMVEEEDLI